MNIKTLVLFLLCIGLFPIPGVAQDTLKNDNYQVWLRSSQQRTLSLGYVQSLSDTTMTLGLSRHKSETGLHVFPVEQVEWVKFRERRSIVRGIGRGALFGFAVGFVYGLIQGDDPPCKKNEWICIRFAAHEKGLLYSVFTTPIAAVAGGVIGSFKTKITIGSRSEYARQREVLEKYRIRQ